MASYATVLSSNANIEEVQISDVKVTQQGGKSARLLYNGNPLLLRLPRLKLPMGVSVREDPKTGNSYSTIVSLRNCDPFAKDKSTDDEVGPLYNFMLALQDKLLDWATENSVKLFGKKRTRDSIEDAFKKILSVSTDRTGDVVVPNGKYPPSLRLKVPVYDGRVSMDVVDARAMQKVLTPSSLLSVFPKHCEANMIIQGSVYVINGNFGVSWVIKFAQVFPQSRVTAATLFAAEEEPLPEEETPVEGVETHLVEAGAVEPPPENAPVHHGSAGGRRRKAT
jgi:hypothetical protein